MTSPMRPWRRLHAWAREHVLAVDVAFAVVVGLVAIAGYYVTEPTGSQRGHDVGGLLLIVGAASALAFRRVRVWPAVAGMLVFSIAFWIADYPSGFDVFTLLALYAAVAHGGADRRLVWRRVAAANILLLSIALLGVFAPGEDLPPIALVGIFTVHLTASFVGEAVYDRARRIADLQARAERAETERELLARQAVLDERARIAREMHDVVAHGVSVMVVQAGAAERLVDTDPETARRSLANIQTVGRDALAEMRQLLGLLRSAGGETERRPQATLADVERVVAHAGQSGVNTELEIRGERPALPIGVDMAGFRVVQEAITNVIKHGGDAASARVTLTYCPSDVRIEVIDDGVGATSTEVSEATGQGIVGMRERVELFGGELRAGPRPGGGFRVLAVIPAEFAAASRAGVR
jgi:signal transduction histidine kinase